MANYWLLKTDPDTYSFDDLEREGQTVWDGVSNPQALIYLRQMRAGDSALIYHSGADKCLMGLAEIRSDPYASPKAANPKLVVVDLRCGKRVGRRVTLAEIKADGAFAEFGLVRQSRLSVMPVPSVLWKRLSKAAEF